MATEFDRVHARLDQLIRRLERVESVLGLEQWVERRPSAPATPLAPPTSSFVSSQLPFKQAPVTPSAPIIDRTLRDEDVRAESAALQAVPPAPSAFDEVREAPATRSDRAYDFERAVGSRWLAWVGALIVVAGIGLFVKYAYDQGWIRITPAWRCIAGAGFGVFLLGVGEMLRRKIGPVAAAGVLAAGVGSIYASALASHELYQLVPPSVALIMLGGTSLIGIGVALRSRLISVGALSLIGGYLAPVLVTGETLSTIVLPAYILLLLALGVILAGWRGGKFGLLRFVAWWGTILLGTYWVAKAGRREPTSSIPFLFLAWAFIHAELGWTAHRGFAASEEPALPHDWDAFNKDWRRWRPLLSSFGMTAWATGLAILIAKQNRPDLDWLAPALGAAASAISVGVLLLGSRRRGLSADSKHLALSLAAQGGGLVLLAIGMAVTGWVMAMGWLMLGLASACVAVMVRSRPLLVYSLVALIAGTGRLLVYDWAFSGMNRGGYEFIGLRLTTWTGMMLIAAVSWAVVGVLGRNRLGEAMQPLSMVCLGIATMLTPTAFLHPNAAAGAMSGVLLISGVVCAALHRGTKSVLFLGAAPVLLLFGLAMAFGTAWWTIGPATWEGVPGLPLRARAFYAVFAGAALLGAGGVMRKSSDSTEIRGLLGIVGAIMFYAALLHESTSTAALFWVWLALSIVIAGAGHLVKGTRFVATALGGTVAATCCWVLAYLDPGWTSTRAPALLHPGLWGASALGGSALLIAKEVGIRLAEEARATLMRSVGIASFALLLTASSLEVARIAAQCSHDAAAQGGAVSIWWAIVSCALIVSGFARRIPVVRHAGLTFLFIVGAKVVLFDLHEVAPAWRIASFLSVGVLMLLVAVGYARLSSMISRTQGS